MTELRFHRSARIELVEAATYYESRRLRYGRKFEADFEAVVERVIRFPESGGLLPDYPEEFAVRAFHFKTFRHVLMVGTVDGVLIVFAVAHHHRRPGYWKNRLLASSL